MGILQLLPCFKTNSGETERLISINGSDINYKSLTTHGSTYATNEVITSKYTWWNFIFKNLIEQFSNLANVYFLLVGILQIIPAITTSAGLPTMYYPLAFIVLVSALRAIAEDVTRHRADKRRNSYLYDVLSGQEWKPTESGDLKVGQIIRVRKNEMIPSDLLLLGTSNDKGHCFIDKANLNGETKLEVYSSIRETRYAVETIPEGAVQQEIDDILHHKPSNDLTSLSLELEYELPNKRFDSFRGIIWLQNNNIAPPGSSSSPSGIIMNKPHNDEPISNSIELSPSKQKLIDVENVTPLPNNNKGKEIRCSGHDLLMRETNLKNTDYIIGLIVYTGNDTKIQRSNLEGEKPKQKVSKVMRLVNLYLIWMFVFQCLLCVVGGLITGIWYGNNGDSWYLRYENTSQKEAIKVGVLAFFTWFINLSYLVPISLVVSGEMVKFIMSFFINADIFLYHPPIRKPAHCNSSTIHEDLGLINYITSDKTGTLTTNSMQFRFAMCSDLNEYGSKETDIAKAVKLRQQELKERELGIYKPKPPPLWSELVSKYHPPRKPNRTTGYDIECCNQNCCLRGRKCPTWCRYFFWSKKHYPTPGQKDVFADDDLHEEDIFAAINPTLAGDSSNCFNKHEKRHLLHKLYHNDNQKQKDILHTYMLHMTLSNTVKPYYEGPKSNPVLKFQPESAEELAMVQFAQKCGYTKLPEKEEHQKTDEEKRLGANTYISIQQLNPDTFKPEGEVKEHTYAFLAVFGFTSARARVSVYYQDIATGNILCMIKGQDTTVTPFLTLNTTDTNEETLLSTLKECCDNGLRTLVAGHAEKSYEWWKPWGEKYNALKQQTLDEKQRAKAEHELFEQIEQSVGYNYLGCIGLEDQLQPLVPETIAACLRAGIKVWMITGDKLETARNIGLACNLIDSDMQPQIKAGDTVQSAMTALDNSRLIEITGEWNHLFQNQQELYALFDIIDFNHDGYISVGEIAILMQTLHTGVDEGQLIQMVLNMLNDQNHITTTTNNSNEVMISPTSSQTSPINPIERNNEQLQQKQDKKEKRQKQQQQNNNDGLSLYDDEPHSDSSDDDENNDKNNRISEQQPSSPSNRRGRRTYSPSRSRLSQEMVNVNKLTVNTQDPRSIAVDRQSFVAILQRFEKSPYEAILYDITEGLERYHRIADHIAYPISMLVSRDAFLVMFPEQGGNIDDPRWPKPTRDQLEDLRRSFFFLASVSKSLIFARAQPSMKKKMVTEIQFRSPEAITLAIGDGANDTDMITAAHIGIGIAGVEGTAATNSADYAIGTFRMLHSLLFVHGFWSYQRIASLVNFIFYKAAILAFTQFLFGIDSGFSGQQFFNDFLLQIYNVIMTSLPIIVLSVMDKHLPRQTAENNVIAYKEQQYQSFNFWVFSLWILRAMFHSALLYFVPKVCLLSDNPFPSYGSSSDDGSTVSRGTMDLWFFSTTVYFATTLLPTLNVFFITKSIQIVNVFVVFLSLIACFLLPWIFSLSFLMFINPDSIGTVALMYSSPTFWLVLVITTFIPMLIELCWQVILVQYFPSLTQILQEQLYIVRQEEKRLNKSGFQLVPDVPQQQPSTQISPSSPEQHEPKSHGIEDLTIKINDDKLAAKANRTKLTIFQPDGSILVGQDGKIQQPTSPMTPLTPQKPDDSNQTTTTTIAKSYGTLDTDTTTTTITTTTATTTTTTKQKAPIVKLERPVLQPEDEHVWLEVKPANVFMRSGNQETNKNSDQLVQSVIAHNKQQLLSPGGIDETTQATKQTSTTSFLPKVFQRSSATMPPTSPAHQQQSPPIGSSPPTSTTGATGTISPEEAMRSGFVRALLRFRNQTGSIFDSAAQSKYHTTTEAVQPSKKESKQPITTTTTTTTRPQTPPNGAANQPQQEQSSQQQPQKPIPKSTLPPPATTPSKHDYTSTSKPQFNNNDEDSIDVGDLGVEISFADSVCRSVQDDQ